MLSRFAMLKKRHSETFETALRQGKVDPQIVSLCEFVKSTKNYFTSSSCSGRILLIEKLGVRKIDNFFHRKWHREISKSELLEALDVQTSGELWFRVDPFILHLGCADLESAIIAFNAMKKAGVKRGGIIVAEPEKFLIEFQGTNVMSFPIKVNEVLLANDLLIDNLVLKANALLVENYRRLARLEFEFRKALI
ncbi:MAG: hypothetical protein QXX06_00385 [Candidatus Diapherotrites archaeon]